MDRTSFLVLCDCGFCCLCCFTWRVNQGHVVTNIQPSLLHQRDCHSLCPLVQLDARGSAGYSTLHRRQVTAETFIVTAAAQ